MLLLVVMSLTVGGATAQQKLRPERGFIKQSATTVASKRTASDLRGHEGLPPLSNDPIVPLANNPLIFNQSLIVDQDTRIEPDLTIGFRGTFGFERHQRIQASQDTEREPVMSERGRGSAPAHSGDSRRAYYGGGHHTNSHGGHYPGSRGPSHKGGHYSNPATGNRYGKHK